MGQQPTEINRRTTKSIAAAPKFWKRMKRAMLSPCDPYQLVDAQDAHDSLQAVGQYVQAHLRAYIGEPLCQEMRRAHPGFQRPEWMLHSLSS